MKPPSKTPAPRPASPSRSPRLTRGIRNNNPGNVRHSKAKWQGAAAKQPDGEFVAFVSPEMGIRALVRTLLTYQTKHGLNTVRGVITRWAPPEGDRNGAAPGGGYTQNTSAYVNAVCAKISRHLGKTIEPNTRLDVDEFGVMKPLVVAIISHENAGYAYPDRVIDEGLRLAGIADAKPRPVAKQPEVQTAVLTSAAAGAAGVSQLLPALQQVRGQLEWAAPYHSSIGVILMVLAVAGAAVTVWAAWDKRRRGVA